MDFALWHSSMARLQATRPALRSEPPPPMTTASSRDPEPPLPPDNTLTQASDPASAAALQQRVECAPEWFCAFLAGGKREKNRFLKELATMKGSVSWLVQQRRQGLWTAEERDRLRSVMRSASSVSPYLLVWVVPGSMLILPFMAWFIDWRRRGREVVKDAA
ncbi:hypothetical protein SAMN05192589_1246 [Paracidovorax valerianellae]|uniref:LETM1-like protein n=2 Tax=Paracidovorax valerianellae TaxID=187868 RepID=A0A1G7EQ17_9BURK|nr:hypothetical protein SAMN05192589_1246 [Paracidovorax valerianellae]